MPRPLPHTHTHSERSEEAADIEGDAGLYWLPLLKFYRIINFRHPSHFHLFSWENTIFRGPKTQLPEMWGRGPETGGGAETMMSFHVHLFRVVLLLFLLHI